MNNQKKIQRIKKTYNLPNKRLPGDIAYDDAWAMSRGLMGFATLNAIGVVLAGIFNYKPSSGEIGGALMVNVVFGYLGGLFFGEKIDNFRSNKAKQKYEGLIDDGAVTVVEHEYKYYLYERLTPRVFDGLTTKNVVEEWEADKICEFGAGDKIIKSYADAYKIGESLEYGDLEKSITNDKTQTKIKQIREDYHDKDIYIRSQDGVGLHFVYERKDKR